MDEFYEWLNNCPVQWFLNSEEHDAKEYRFILPEEPKTCKAMKRGDTCGGPMDENDVCQWCFTPEIPY